MRPALLSNCRKSLEALSTPLSCSSRIAHCAPRRRAMSNRTIAFKFAGDTQRLDVPDGEWLLTVLPELKVLEADTLETMLAQVEQHNR